MRVTTFFALLLGLGVGVCGTMALHFDQPGPDAGDWLGFAGALVGVVFTIIGTLWLEHYRATANVRDDLLILQKTLKEIHDALNAAKKNRGVLPIGEERPKRIEAEERLLRSFNKFIYARHYVPKRNLEAWQVIEELNEAINRERSTVEKEIRTITDAGENEAVLGVNIAIMQEIDGRLVEALTASRTVLAAHEV